MHKNFFVYQRDALRPLLVWGLGSSLLGAVLLLAQGFWRHFGIQALSWGAIDAALAFAGRRGAERKAEQLASQQIDAATAQHAAKQFQRVLLVNAGLDVLYILSGLFTARRFRERADRRGLGVGIAVQGLFLLIFDTLLAREVGRKYLQGNG